MVQLDDGSVYPMTRAQWDDDGSIQLDDACSRMVITDC